MMKKIKSFFGIGNNKNSKKLPSFNSQESEKQMSTLERLRELEDLYKRKQEHLESQIQQFTAEARKHGMKNKRAALMALKRKKRVEAELSKLDGTLTTIEMQREALESAKNNIQVVGAMRDAANVLKNAQKHFSADTVLDIMDEVNEQQELASEIANAIANPLSPLNSTIDELDLERELEALEQEELDKSLLKVGETDIKDAELLEEVATPGTSAGLHEPKGKNADKIGLGILGDEDEKELLELAQWSA